MKKALLIVIGILLMTLGTAGAADLKSIGNTGDAAITTGTGYLKGFIVNTDGTNAVTLAVYDNTAASGTKIISNIVVTTSATNRVTAISFNGQECPFFTGIYVDVTVGGGGSVTYDVFWESK